MTQLALVSSPIVHLLLTLWVLRLYLMRPVLLWTLILLTRRLGCCCCYIDASTCPTATSGDAVGPGHRPLRAPDDYAVGAPVVLDVTSTAVDSDSDASSTGDLQRPPWWEVPEWVLVIDPVWPADPVHDVARPR